MAYNQRNMLNKVREIQDIYLKHHQEGVTSLYIYTTYIKKQYHISQRTYEKYLGINVKLELKRLDDAANNNNNDQRPVQGQLDF